MSTPEITLWKSIIYTIFDDADRDIHTAMTAKFLDLQLSKRLLEIDHPWFQMMCDTVEIHPDYVKRALVVKYNEAKKDPRLHSQHLKTSNSSEVPK